MRHPFVPATLALSITVALAGLAAPGAALAANANTEQFQLDLQNNCGSPPIETEQPPTDSIDNSNNLNDQLTVVAQGASVISPESTLCANYQDIQRQYANDPTALAAVNAQLAEDVTPDEVPAMYTSLVQLSTDQIRNVSHHLRNQRYQAQKSDETASNSRLNGYYGGTAGDTVPMGRLSVFVDGSKVDGSQDDTTYEVGYDLETDHYTVGVDYRLNNNLIAGFAFGNSDTTLEYSEAQNQTDNDTDHYILYTSWYRDNFAVDTLMGFAQGEFDTRRNILGSDAIGNTDSELTYFNIAGSYDFVDGAFTYGPFSSFDYLDGTIDGFEESNGGGWEAAFADQDVKSQIFALGGNASYVMSFGWGVLIPHARAEWRTELEDDRDLIVGRFVQDPASSFSITPDEVDSNWYQVSGGVSAQFTHGIAAFLDYEEVLEYDDTDLSIVTLGVRWEM